MVLVSCFGWVFSKSTPMVYMLQPIQGSLEDFTQKMIGLNYTIKSEQPKSHQRFMVQHDFILGTTVLAISYTPITRTVYSVTQYSRYSYSRFQYAVDGDKQSLLNQYPRHMFICNDGPNEIYEVFNDDNTQRGKLMFGITSSKGDFFTEITIIDEAGAELLRKEKLSEMVGDSRDKLFEDDSQDESPLNKTSANGLIPISVGAIQFDNTFSAYERPHFLYLSDVISSAVNTNRTYLELDTAKADYVIEPVLSSYKTSTSILKTNTGYRYVESAIKFTAKIKVNLILRDRHSHTMVNATIPKNVEVSTEDDYYKLFNVIYERVKSAKLVRDLLESAFPIRGTISDINSSVGGKQLVILNIGSADGLCKNMWLNVYKNGSQNKEPIATIVADSVQEHSTICKLQQSKKNSTILKSDIAILYVVSKPSRDVEIETEEALKKKERKEKTKQRLKEFFGL